MPTRASVRASKKSPLTPWLAPLALAACSPSAPVPPAPPPMPSAVASAPPAPFLEPPPPTFRLPADTRPTAERIEISVSPEEARFSGTVDIDVTLDRARRALWLHGRGLHVTRATVTPEGAPAADGEWKQAADDGLASITVASPVPAGRATVHVEFDAPLVETDEGLFVAKEAGIPYAFTQFEATGARRAFPCLDEPGFKIPWDIALVVPEADQAISNGPEISRVTAGAGKVRVSFAKTRALPSYLLAFAVGPLDVVAGPDVPKSSVRATPLPLRGVAPKGRGKELAYALAHSGALLTSIEEYVGIAFPYDKLDLIAAPGKGGAMENAGAIISNEYVVLLRDDAPRAQRRTFAEITAHEIAHQWFGDLVTMQWWDDTWLNEAFATWMAPKTVDAVEPSVHADVDLLENVTDAMKLDSLAGARQVRQPVDAPDDISNAFDGITYEKGAAVLGMLEAWVGEDVFRRAVHAHLAKHALGNATADDFVSALSAAAGRDVAPVARSFLEQPGVPYVEGHMTCDDSGAHVHLTQARHLPLGSAGDETPNLWSIPVRLGGRGVILNRGPEDGDRALEIHGDAMLDQPVADVDLSKTCPAWFFPNEGGRGYYYAGLAKEDLERLTKNGLAKLGPRELIAFVAALGAGVGRGSVAWKDALGAVTPLASHPQPVAALAASEYVTEALDWFAKDPGRADVERYGRTLYGPVATRLGWAAVKDEDDDTTTRRRSILGFLARANDPTVRAEALRRGRAYLGLGGDGALHADAVDPNLAGMVVGVVGAEADAKTFDALVERLVKTDDEGMRRRLINAIGSAKDPALVARARELSLSDRIRRSEMGAIVSAQFRRPELRDDTWEWVKANWDALAARFPAHRGGLGFINLTSAFCDEARATEVTAFYTPRLASIEGAPRVLRTTAEAIRVCAARRKAHEASARAAFAPAH